MKTRVLIVDDSAIVRKVLADLIAVDPDFDVVGQASDAYQARELIKQLQPDVLTLDIEMPRMHGLEFLRRLMHGHPMPVVMISTLTEHGSQFAIDALQLGAVEVMKKPEFQCTTDWQPYREELLEKLRAAAAAKSRIAMTQKTRKSMPLAATRQLPILKMPQLIAIGASTGGTEVLRQIVSALPTHCPPVVMVQHMPAGFTQSFAKRLDDTSAIRVIESKGQERLERGNAYLAPGGKHLVVEKRQGMLYTQLCNDEPVNRHKPAVDVLFQSVANLLGKSVIGVIMTGMGQDGARGLLALRQQGATTYGQDERSSIVYGMPREAFECGAVQYQGNVEEITDALVRSCERSNENG